MRVSPRLRDRLGTSCGPNGFLYASGWGAMNAKGRPWGGLWLLVSGFDGCGGTQAPIPTFTSNGNIIAQYQILNEASHERHLAYFHQSTAAPSRKRQLMGTRAICNRSLGSRSAGTPDPRPSLPATTLEVPSSCPCLPFRGAPQVGWGLPTNDRARRRSRAVQLGGNRGPPRRRCCRRSGGQGHQRLVQVIVCQSANPSFDLAHRTSVKYARCRR